MSLKDLLDGDMNLDGTVNNFDFQVLVANWQRDGRAWTTGDVNFDGTVNNFDFQSLVANWQSVVTGGGFATVPEPASAMLIALGSLAVIRRRRK